MLDETAVLYIGEKLPDPENGVPTIAAVLIDPGHGGKDPGAIGSHTIDDEKIRINEKDIVLDVSRQLYQALALRYPDKQIMLTRDDDTFISLENRVNKANSISLGDHEAIIYISIHANASLNSKAHGFEVWYLPPDYRRTLIDQKSIEAGSEEAYPYTQLHAGRGVHNRKYSPCPAGYSAASSRRSAMSPTTGV